MDRFSSDTALWLSSLNIDLAEIAAQCGCRTIVVDIEHNPFPLADRTSFVVLAKKLGMQVFIKIEWPTEFFVQQALDIGVDGVIIPHIEGLEQARLICGSGKYPPGGTRSFSGGRVSGFGVPDESFFAAADERVLILPMIETSTALAEVEAIAALDCVDGLFLGPYDLSLTSGRGNYTYKDGDRADASRIAKAAKAAGKVFWAAAWSPAERAHNNGNGVDMQVVMMEHAIYRAGIKSLLAHV